ARQVPKRSERLEWLLNHFANPTGSLRPYRNRYLCPTRCWETVPWAKTSQNITTCICSPSMRSVSA
ncbi:unnamed protein product, partial [Clonostachys solani]